MATRVVVVVGLVTLGVAATAIATVEVVRSLGLLTLALALVLAAAWLDRRALVSMAVVAVAAPWLAAFLAWANAEAIGRELVFVGGLAGVGLVVLAVVLDRVVIGERERLEAAQRRLAHLSQVSSRQAKLELDRANLERALAQAQRLEALGRLAGSVAHDFNNLLAGIQGNVELAAMLADDRGQRDAALETANALVDRAAALTRNLLRFAKGQAVDAELVDVNALIRESEPIYRSLVRRQIELHLELGARRSTLAFNPAQLEQLLLNLLVNASDAMPSGGELRIATHDREDGRLELSVADTGQGISQSIQVMMFQPYFTTKGEGTGIGLATVHDIVEAAGGEIQVDSVVGQGTQFCVLLPVHDPGDPADGSDGG